MIDWSPPSIRPDSREAYRARYSMYYGLAVTSDRKATGASPTRHTRRPLEAEDVAGPPAPAPDGAPVVPVDLPAAVAPDDGRALIDAEHGSAARGLQRQQGGKRLRHAVVSGQDRDPLDHRESIPPAERP